MIRTILLAGALSLTQLAQPAFAADVAPLTAKPVAAVDPDVAAYRAIFAAIRAHDWATASAALDAKPIGLLTPVARAELFLAKGAPQPDAAAVTALLTTSPGLPQAPALAKLARSLGATALPALPAQQALTRLSGASKRTVARPNAAAATLFRTLQPILKTNDAATAEPLVEAASGRLTPEALTELRQRVAWAYFLAADDRNAMRVAGLARGGSGDWAVQGAWVQGLAGFRSNDMATSADAFGFVSTQARDAETIAAGLFWAARADTAGGHPERVGARLRSAARMSETFYGMLAGAQLGLTADAIAAIDPDATVLKRPNARAAVALAAIGETSLADQMLRQQARIGDPVEHCALVALAERLGLPTTQVWLAQYGPAAVVPTLAARYPMPAWSPSGGWRVDRSLLLAHALQESQLRADAVSPVGARGLMQLMPGTVKLVARHRGDDMSALDRVNDPSLNFEYGQSYLEELADHAGTGGLLPKVIAAYNAGPGNVLLWNARPGAARDPLLFIESIPFAETRGYVAIVLRNYWMYQREAGVRAISLAEMAEGRWPRLPVARAQIVALGSTPAAGIK